MSALQVMAARTRDDLCDRLSSAKKRNKEDQGSPGGSDPDGPLPVDPPTVPPPPGPSQPTPLPPEWPGPKGQGLALPSWPDEPTFGGGDDGPEQHDEPNEWPEYPPRGPVDLRRWMAFANYPMPSKFHQIGGPNSGTTLESIAIKALTSAFYIVHGDLALARELANREDNWRAYRDAINCCPWNHALFGSANQPGTPYHYETPHDDHISLYPVHDDVQARLRSGETPRRRVSEHDPKVPAGGHHALIWLPPLDVEELLEGRAKVEHDPWWTGDFRMMPPPEVLTLGLANIPAGRVWGCGGYQTSYEHEEDL